ncbi:uncharacterized protein LOC123895689 [Trifolium pratense]|uniref:Uncharacterized protein n=1 Tax=Trifolium pratense TaxID=57577 RepID=A0ACB0LUS8_TRIPR|nr:uncharacterized protein LOC123895689 [Trifolium pratense]CAJ2672610.1 unnamed protein product [Trifolium pratense]
MNRAQNIFFFQKVNYLASRERNHHPPSPPWLGDEGRNNHPYPCVGLPEKAVEAETPGDQSWGKRKLYGHLPSPLLGCHDNIAGRNSSLWWRDIIGSGKSRSFSWFKSNIGCCVGNGNDIELWNFKWFGSQALCDLFPDLYVHEADKYAKVAERLDSSVTVPRWRWSWLAPLDENDEQRLLELEGLLSGFSFQSTALDHWRWIPDVNGIFSVKSSYASLLSSRQAETLDNKVLDAIQQLWRTDVQSKISFFGWSILRIVHTFSSRAILLMDYGTKFYLGFKTLPLGAAGIDHFMAFGELFNVKDKWRIRHLVWLATTWNLWKVRNNVIFNGGIMDESALLEEIKLTSWLWFSRRFGRKACIHFSSWCLDPLSCIHNS